MRRDATLPYIRSSAGKAGESLRECRKFLTLLAAPAALLGGMADVAAAHDEPVVEVSNGEIRGMEQRGALAFLGIPYGAPTGGESRFRPASPAADWSGIREARQYGPKCPQNPLPLTPALSRVLKFADIGQSEDCLSLNVWTPAVTGSRPVLVWLHGGGFTTGTGAEPDYEGANLASRNDVVVVTLNHRLNLFGHLDLSDWDEDYADSANAGMLDIVLALEWVRENAETFGGDPGNVTIFGQSGGGYKVSTLLAMPPAVGLFHKAAIISGPGVQAKSREDALQTAAETLSVLDVEPVDRDALAHLSVDALLEASVGSNPAARQRLWGPVVDGRSLPRHPFDPVPPEQSSHIPIMIGYTADEGNIFLFADPRYPDMPEAEMMAQVEGIVGPDNAGQVVAMYRAQAPDDGNSQLLGTIMADLMFGRGTYQIADRRAGEDGAASVYMYRVEWDSPVEGGVLKAAHGIDMPLWFDNADHVNTLVGTEPESLEISTMMGTTIAAFARTGDPNNPLLPDWPAYTVPERALMIFDTPPHVERDPRSEVREMLEAAPR